MSVKDSVPKISSGYIFCLILISEIKSQLFSFSLSGTIAVNVHWLTIVLSGTENGMVATSYSQCSRAL